MMLIDGCVGHAVDALCRCCLLTLLLLLLLMDFFRMLLLLFVVDAADAVFCAASARDRESGK